MPELRSRGDSSAIQAQFLLTWPEWKKLKQQFGAAATRPLRSLVAVCYPSEAAFRQALDDGSDLRIEHIDAAFWHNGDAGRRRFLEGLGWLLDYRDSLIDYAQLMGQSKTNQS